jgi:acetyltransferase EpsM
MSVHAVLVPLLNPNEPEAVLVQLFVTVGQHVTVDEVLCTLETTKSTHELIAEKAGFVAGLRFSAGENVNAGDLFCYLTETAGETLPAPAPSSGSGEVGSSPLQEPPAGMRITQPALALARERGLNLTDFPADVLVTEKMVRARLEQGQAPARPAEIAAPNPFRILIFGGGGHAKAVIDLIRALRSYPIAGILDDHLDPGTTVMGVPVLGTAALLESLYNEGLRLAVNAVGGISKMETRIRVFESLAGAGFSCPTLVHPSAWVEPGAELSAGIQVFPHAYLGSESRVGFGCIVNTGAVVSHDCVLDPYVNLSPGALLAGNVRVGRGTLIGMGVTVNLGVSVGENARLGNSAVIKSDVPDGAIVRAGAVFPQ